MHFWLAENKSIIIIIIIIYYYYYYSIIMQHACKVVKQVQITNCTHTQNFVCFDSLWCFFMYMINK